MENKNSGGMLKSANGVRLSRKDFYTAIFSRIVKMVALVILSLVVVYVCFAGTILRFVPTNSDLGLYLVKAPIYETGVIPVGGETLVSLDEPVDKSFFGKIKTAFTMHENVALIEIQGGPLGELTWTDEGLVAVNGRIIESNPLGFNPKKEYLSEEYIGVCIEGNCVPGDLIITDDDHIYGIPAKN